MASCCVMSAVSKTNNAAFPSRRCPLATRWRAFATVKTPLVLHTRYYQPIPLVLRGYGAGAQVTAAGVFADLLRPVMAAIGPISLWQ